MLPAISHFLFVLFFKLFTVAKKNLHTIIGVQIFFDIATTFGFNTDAHTASSKRAWRVWCEFAIEIWNALWTSNDRGETVLACAETASVRVEEAEEEVWVCSVGSKFRDTGCCSRHLRTGAIEGLRRRLDRARKCTRCLCDTRARCARTRNRADAAEVLAFLTATRRPTQTCR
jgi:hypothetical protein